MVEDKVFAEKMENLDGKGERTAFIKQEGFDFSMEELTAAASELNTVDVVGGDCCGTTCEIDNVKWYLDKIRSDAELYKVSMDNYYKISGLRRPV
jgi:hypothetical protein